MCRTSLIRLPRLNGQEVDLYLLYSLVTARGGWEKVNIASLFRFFFSPRLVYVGRRVARIAQVEAAKTWPKFKVEPDYWEQDSIQNFRWIRYPRLDPADSEIAWIKTLVTNCHFAYVGVCWSSSGSSRADRSSKVGQSSRLPLRSLYRAFFFWQLIETFKRLFIFLFYYI